MQIPRLESARLAALPHIRHAFFTRQGGVSEGLYASLNTGLGSKDKPARIAENRGRCAKALGVASARLVSLYQIHSNRAVTLDDVPPERPEADGIASVARGLGLGILAADCGPVLFADAREPIIGAAHAGWKGALTGVLESTLDAMEKRGAQRSRIVAVLGPCISAEAYEVGPEFKTRFAQADRASPAFFRAAPREDHFLFDLPGYVGARLKRAGVGEIEILGACTYGEPERFFSYRRATHRGEADYGRNLSAIALT
jgi:YfiH family protein